MPWPGISFFNFGPYHKNYQTEHLTHEHDKFQLAQEYANEYFINIARLETKRLGKTFPWRWFKPATMRFVHLSARCPGTVAEWWSVCTRTLRYPYLLSGVNQINTFCSICPNSSLPQLGLHHQVPARQSLEGQSFNAAWSNVLKSSMVQNLLRHQMWYTVSKMLPRFEPLLFKGW